MLSGEQASIWYSYLRNAILVTDSGRRLVRNVLIHDEKGHYGIDFEVFEEHSVTFTSPSKTFNTAGLQIAEIIAHDPL